MNNFSLVRSVLKSGGFKGYTKEELLNETNLTVDELNHQLATGIQTFGTEVYESNGNQYYRLRPNKKDITKRKYRGSRNWRDYQN